MKRRLSLYAGLLATVTCLPAAIVQPTVTADTYDHDLNTGESVVRGHATLSFGKIVLKGDEIRYQTKTGMVVAKGNVIVFEDNRRVLCDQVTYDTNLGTFVILGPKLGEFPLYLVGSKAEGTADQIVVTDAVVSYGEPGAWIPSMSTKRLIIDRADKTFSSESAQVGLGDVRPFPFPGFNHSSGFSLKSYMSLQAGYRGNLGVFADSDVRVPVYPGLRLGGEVGVFSKRGFLIGPGGSYDISDGADSSMKGSLRTGFINDHGDRTTDVLGNAIGSHRSYIEWEHHQIIGPNLSLDGSFNDWSDSEVIRDFHRNQFYNVQVPDSYLESVYSGANYSVSVFTRVHPNSYFATQERLPEIRYDLMPTPVALGVYQRGSASLVVLRDNPPGSTQPTLQSNRGDAFYALTRNFSGNEWSGLTAVVGGRVTNYSDMTEGSAKSSYTRALGEVGFDAHLLASGVFNYKNEQWKIDGLRHLVKPFVSYRYIPEGDQGRKYIPKIDRETFNTYLQPLELGESRRIDDLHKLNTLRFGVENTLQTRDPGYGSRNLATLTLANDVRFTRQEGEHELSDTHIDASLTPVRWFTLDSYQRIKPRTGLLEESNTGFSMHDGEEWTWSLSRHYLVNDIAEYVTYFEKRMNESYRGYVRFHYSERTGQMTEHSYGVIHNVSNVWLFKYEVAFYNGPRREGGFELRFDVEARGF